MRKKVASILGLMTLSISFPAFCGPFGLDFKNFSLAESGCADQKGSFYTCKSVPKPHPDIELYVIQYVEGVGLCMIKGISRDISDSIYGDNIRRKTDEIYDQLTTKYGKGEKLDFLRPGSIWDEPEDWMMGIIKDERTYAVLWQLSSPVEEVSEIVLAAQATSRDSGYFIVEFYNSNSAQCDSVQSEKAAESF